MPYGNGTGPWWARGNWSCRRGFGFGMGRGFGFGRMQYYPQDTQIQNQQFANQQYTTENELEELKNYAEQLKTDLKNITNRINELTKKK